MLPLRPRPRPSDLTMGDCMWQEGFKYLQRNGLAGQKAVLLGWNGEDTDGFLQAMRVSRLLFVAGGVLLLHPC